MARSLFVLGVAGAALVAGCSVFGVRSGLEQPAYAVIDRVGPAVEVRRYAPRLAAEAVVAAPDADAGRSAAFRLLFDYISGANRPDAEIAMTAPVAATSEAGTIAMTAPVAAEPRGDGRYAMRFFLPKSYTSETAPEPTDPRVRLLRLPAEDVAALGFSGRWTAETLASETRGLMRALEASSWRPTARPVTLFYDPPFTLPFLRRNEAAVPVERREAGGS